MECGKLGPALGNAGRRKKRRQAAALQKRKIWRVKSPGQGKIRRMEGDEGTWPTGQLVVGSA